MSIASEIIAICQSATGKVLRNTAQKHQATCSSLIQEITDAENQLQQSTLAQLRDVMMYRGELNSAFNVDLIRQFENSKYKNLVDSYQNIIARAQNELFYIMEDMNDATFVYHIAIPQAGYLKVFELNRDQIFRLETNSDIFRINTTASNLLSGKTLNFSSHTNLNLTVDKMLEALKNIGVEKAIIDTSESTAMEQYQDRWKDAQSLRRKSNNKKISRSDALEAFLYSVFDEKEYKKLTAEGWVHNNLSGLVNADVIIKASKEGGKKKLIQSKLFVQANKYQIEAQQNYVWSQFYGFYSLSNLSNIKAALQYYNQAFIGAQQGYQSAVASGLQDNYDDIVKKWAIEYLQSLLG